MKIKANTGVARRLNRRPACVSDVALGKRKPKLLFNSGNRSKNGTLTLTVRRPCCLMGGADTVRHWCKCMDKYLSMAGVGDLPPENDRLKAGIIRRWSNNGMQLAISSGSIFA